MVLHTLQGFWRFLFHDVGKKLHKKSHQIVMELTENSIKTQHFPQKCWNLDAEFGYLQTTKTLVDFSKSVHLQWFFAYNRDCLFADKLFLRRSLQTILTVLQ